MAQPQKRDHYSILGVDSGASAGEIRNAYLARTRVVHPDRFNPHHQSQDWAKANEMLAELNEAYFILGNPKNRKQYDRVRSGAVPKSKSSSKPDPGEAPSQPPFEFENLASGHTTFSRLPAEVQRRLVKRQRNSGEEQFQVKLAGSVAWNYGFVSLLLCWFWYLFSQTRGLPWKEDTLLWFSGITIAVGTLIGINLVRIMDWIKSTLRPHFYVTPVYFIKTSFDTIRFHPLSSLKDINLTHNYVSRFYRNTTFVLKFDGYSETLLLSSKRKAEAMLKRIREYESQLRKAYSSRDHQYFVDHDDFFKVARSSSTPVEEIMPKKKRGIVYAVSVSYCVLGLCAAIAVNSAQSAGSVEDVRMPDSARTLNDPLANDGAIGREFPPPGRTAFNGRASASDEENGHQTPAGPSMPESGILQNFTPARRIAPFDIRAAQGSHYLVKLVDTRTSKPALTVFVQSNATVHMKVPLGTYQVKYASGKTWYGYDRLFGSKTSYSKADRTLTFNRSGDEINGYVMTLYEVENGNLPMSAIPVTEF